jgi:ABC-type multidrug transport system fused ATPase/permease subunit
VLRSATIITVAHRLRTIADSDLIVVIQDGAVVEQGSPEHLLTHHNESIFKQLVSESNEFDDILKLAQKRNEISS